MLWGSPIEWLFSIQDLEASREASQKATGAMKDVESKIDTVAMDVRQLMSKKLQVSSLTQHATPHSHPPHTHNHPLAHFR